VAEHFAFEGAGVMGLTPVGRATAQVLDLNDVRRLKLRAEIIKRGHLT
jgi:hypothetical protein